MIKDNFLVCRIVSIVLGMFFAGYSLSYAEEIAPGCPRIRPAEAEAEVGGGGLSALSLSFVGDIMAHTPNFTMSNYDRIYRAVSAPLLADDLSFANLEFVIDERRPMAGYPQFNVHRDYVEAAIRAGFDAFSTANNHSNDYGEAGIVQTQQNIAWLFEKAGRPLYASGLRDDPGDSLCIESLHYRGWHIGFLALTGISNRHGRGMDYVHFVPIGSKAARDRLLALVRERRPAYDLFILSWHGEAEYRLEPEAEKAALFVELIEAGVDIVWGHHPHVLQPVEFYFRDDGRRAVIMYSLGNFISSQPWNLRPDRWNWIRAYTGDSAIVQLNVRMAGAGAGAGATVEKMELLPITHLQHFAPDPALPDRDGFEVHLGSRVEEEAAAPWKAFYGRRAEIMRLLIESFSHRYTGTADLLP